MDLAIGAKQVFVMREHPAGQGESKAVPACAYPLTGMRRVKRIHLDLADIDVTPRGLHVRDVLDGLHFLPLQRLTAAPRVSALSTGAP